MKVHTHAAVWWSCRLEGKWYQILVDVGHDCFSVLPLHRGRKLTSRGVRVIRERYGSFPREVHPTIPTAIIGASAEGESNAAAKGMISDVIILMQINGLTMMVPKPQFREQLNWALQSTKHCSL